MEGKLYRYFYIQDIIVEYNIVWQNDEHVTLMDTDDNIPTTYSKKFANAEFSRTHKEAMERRLRMYEEAVENLQQQAERNIEVCMSIRRKIENLTV